MLAAELLDLTWRWGPSAFALTSLVVALGARPWRIWLDPRSQHPAFGSIVLLAALSVLRVRFPGLLQGVQALGVPVQLIGAPLLVVMFGLRPALPLLAAAALLGASQQPQAPEGVVALLSDALERFAWFGALPALLTAAGHALIRRLLSRQLFVFIFGHGYFVPMLAAIGSTLLGAVYAQQARNALHLDWTEVVAAAVAMGFAEAFITGLLTAIFVVYRPDWVLTFDDREYLRER